MKESTTMHLSIRADGEMTAPEFDFEVSDKSEPVDMVMLTSIVQLFMELDEVNRERVTEDMMQYLNDQLEDEEVIA